MGNPGLCRCSKDDGPGAKRDLSGRHTALALKNMAELWYRAMQDMHCRHVRSLIALHSQHDYLADIEGNEMPHQ